MILHIMPTEKFTDYAIQQFSAPVMESEFVLIPIDDPLESVKQRDKTRIIRYNSAEYEEFLRHLGDYTSVVLHSTHYYWAGDVLRVVPNHVKVAWVLWGGDVYGRSDISHTFIAPITKIISSIHNLSRKYIKRKLSTSWQMNYNLFQRIDYCMTSQTEEYDYAVNYCKKSFKRLWYTYYSMEEMTGVLMNERCKGSSVWLGNSATTSNNHFDALRMMSKHKRALGNRKVIIPLSYSEPWIANSVSKIAGWLFGKNSQPLMKMMPRDEYNALMLDCSTMIMPHYMSQAMGNIYTGLWLGMRVYMSEKNISYHYLKRIGANVYTLEHDFKIYGYTPLSDELVEQNRAALMKVYGKEHVMKEIENVVKELSKEKDD